MKILIIFIGLDVITGIAGGFIDDDLNSNLGLKGLIKHSIIILIMFTLKFISDLYALQEYFNLLIIFYLVQYSISLLENCYNMGIPVPKGIVKKLQEYQRKEKLDQWEND